MHLRDINDHFHKVCESLNVIWVYMIIIRIFPVYRSDHQTAVNSHKYPPCPSDKPCFSFSFGFVFGVSTGDTVSSTSFLIRLTSLRDLQAFSLIGAIVLWHYSIMCWLNFVSTDTCCFMIAEDWRKLLLETKLGRAQSDLPHVRKRHWKMIFVTFLYDKNLESLLSCLDKRIISCFLFCLSAKTTFSRFIYNKMFHNTQGSCQIIVNRPFWTMLIHLLCL